MRITGKWNNLHPRMMRFDEHFLVTVGGRQFENIKLDHNQWMPNRINQDKPFIFFFSFLFVSVFIHLMFGRNLTGSSSAVNENAEKKNRKKKAKEQNFVVKRVRRLQTNFNGKWRRTKKIIVVRGKHKGGETKFAKKKKMRSF